MDTSSYNGTLTTTAFYILLAVAKHPLHGYGVCEQVIRDSYGELIIPVGTLYPALRRLTKGHLLEQFEATDPSGPSMRYRITPQGQRKLEAEAKRLSHVAHQARLKLGQTIF